jgi:WhiB family redox-sensing transcriptional regulator
VFAVMMTERVRVMSRLEEMVVRFKAKEMRRRAKCREVDVPPTAQIHTGWQTRAACRTHDERLAQWMSWLFSTETGCRWQTNIQKQICASCPVRIDCLLTGVEGDEPFGIWGGATLLERKLLSARWRKEGLRSCCDST